MLTKALDGESHDEYIGRIYSAFNEKYDWTFSIVGTYNEYIVVWDRNEKSHYKITYTESEEALEFAAREDWEQVKLKKEWVAKFITGDPLTEDDFILNDDSPEIPSAYSVKALGGNRVGGYAMIWGSEEEKDLHGEWFTPETKDTKSIFEQVGVLPFIVHHGADNLVKSFVAGKVDVLENDDLGLWWEATVADFQAYTDYVQPLLKKDMAFTSTGTLPAAKRVKPTGEITRWPIAEVSVTWSPAEWRMINLPINEVKSYFEEVGADPAILDGDSKDGQPSDNGTEKSQGAEKARLRAVLELEKTKIALLTLDIGEY